ncbi:MAG: 8-amino-7-oxononanoate synthase [Candidatus Omnitrophota bacterium]|nr:8-amino-7-oxononanoate synthase [Candidatus Omnitrophota bacterium]
MEKRKQQGLLRNLRLLEGEQEVRVKIDGRNVINFCSNNYLGLANDPRLKDAAIEAIKKYGLGSGASRLVCGNMVLHKKLEEKIAEFKNQEACLVFNSGYTANLGIISAIMDKDGIVFSDRLNHASIIDGIVLSRANFRRFPHNDMSALEELLNLNNNPKKKLVVTDTVFSMDGDIASLPEIVKICQKNNALLMIDEAHATGIFGKMGGGVAQHFGLKDEIDIQMGTLSKAMGCFGAFVCGKKDLIDYLINFSRAFIYTTSLPPSICASSIKAIEIIQLEPERRQRLWTNIKFLKEQLCNLGFNTLKSNSAIIPILIKNPILTMEFSQSLFEEGIFVQGIRPPTVARNESRLRITVTSKHCLEDLEFALEKLKKIGRKLCLI